MLWSGMRHVAVKILVHLVVITIPAGDKHRKVL